MIKNAGDVEVSFIGQLPQDEMGKMSMAQIAREGQTPLLPDIYIRDNILGLQSADQMEDAIKSQAAERMLPEAAIWELLKSANRQGREDLAELYQAELRRLFMTKRMEEMQMVNQMMQPQQPPPPPQGMPPQGMPPQGGAGPMLPPTVMPDAALGVPPPTPTAPVGPSVPPGTPRPGAQGTEGRLAELGLVPPTGGD